MNRILRAVALVCSLVMLACYAACTGDEKAETPDPAAAFERILAEVKFAAPLEDNSEYAEYMFSELPEGTTVRMYAAGGQYTDAAILFTVKDEADLGAVRTAANAYLESVKEEFRLYHPEEMPKLENAVIRNVAASLILVVTEDVETVNAILG